MSGFQVPLRRVIKAQPDIFLQNHEGYYRHADVAAIVQALVDHRAAVQNLLDDDYGTANARQEARALMAEWLK